MPLSSLHAVDVVFIVLKVGEFPISVGKVRQIQDIWFWPPRTDPPRCERRVFAVEGCFQDLEPDIRDFPYECREGGETAADDAASYFCSAVVFVSSCILALIVFALGRTLPAI